MKAIVGCWDSDFRFDVPSSPDRATACKRLRQCESISNEDWDLELSFGTPETIVPREPRNEDEEPLVIVDNYAPAPITSLLDYLNNFNLESLALTKQLLNPLPRQPTLFSAYINYQRRLSKIPGQVVDQQKKINSVFARPRSLANDCFLMPYGPESAAATVRWLQVISEEVCNTSMVVARPSPERIGIYIGRERPPSKELRLEQALRAAEMAYCNLSWHDSSAHTKALLYRLENKKNSRSTVPNIDLLRNSLTRPTTIDDDLRRYQCCGRLARLVCRIAQCRDKFCAAGLLKTAPLSCSLQLDRCEYIWHMPLDACDVAAFRRGAANLLHDIDDYLLRAKSKLIIDESLTHLALVHMRPTWLSVCEQIPPEDSTMVNKISPLFLGGCWCGALPPLPRSGIAGALDVTHSLRKELRSQAANEIEALVLADMRLEAMGYSPLTTERLCPGEPPKRSCRSVVWRDELQHRRKHISSRITFEDSIACKSGVALESALEGEWSLNASGRIEGRLVTLVSVLPPSSLARAKATLALGLNHLRGIERLRGHKVMAEYFFTPVRGIPQKLRRGCRALHATQELRIAEMLLFEATCVLEQHMTTKPVDLPFHAHRCSLDLATCCGGAPTSYSVLACSMGYTALRGLARAFERRAKHAYAVLVLDVCVAILRLRDYSNETRKLRRELCVVSTRQGNSETGASHCKYILRDLRDCLEDRARDAILQPPETPMRDDFTEINYIATDSAAMFHVQEVFFTTHLLVTQLTRLGGLECAYEMIVQFQRDSVNRQNICTTISAIHELRHSLRLGDLYAACTLLAHSEPGCAVDYLDHSLAFCPMSLPRRIALLSYLVEAKVLCGDATGARNSLRRINRLRQRDMTDSLSRQPWNVHSNTTSEMCCALWSAAPKGRLILFCDDNFDLGQFAAEILLLESAPKRALKKITHTVAAVEAAVSRLGSAFGLSKLGSLYELRGRAQAALASYTRLADYPLHLTNFEDNADDSGLFSPPYCHRQKSTISHQIAADDMLRWSQSRHYKCYVSEKDVRVDALRWYRHALECYRATDDSYGAAHAASTFATLYLNTVFLKHVLTSSVPREFFRSINARLEDVSSAARRALDIAAIVDEPLLLLEAYLNVAELLHVCKDPLGAIAHWWEARELVLQLFVDSNIVPLTVVADLTTILQLRKIFERLLRFLAAVADRAMIDENLLLFDVCILFECDTVHRRSRTPACSCRLSRQDARNDVSNSCGVVSKLCASRGVVGKDVLSCWYSLLKIREDVTRHCLGELSLSELHIRNRNSLCGLVELMRQIRVRNPIKNFPNPPTSFAIHAAGVLFVYAPQLGWRHAIAFGSSAQGLGSTNACLIGALAGARCAMAEPHCIEHRRVVLRQTSYIVALPCNFFSTALAVEGKERQVATLACSERAQVLPWEFMSDVAISRILGIAAAAGRFISLPSHLRRVEAYKPQQTNNKASQRNDDTLQTNTQHVIGLIIQALSSTASPDCEGLLQIPPSTNPASKTGLFLRPYDGFCSCLAWCSKVAVDTGTSGFMFVVLPLSTLYALPERLTVFQIDRTELFFAPDGAVMQIADRIYAQANFADGALLAKAITDDLALPTVHSWVVRPVV